MALKDNMIGNKKIAELLERSYARDKMSHAYLFDGAEHIGKMTLALDFCRMVLEDPRQDIEKDPDVIFVSPIEDKKEIIVDQIRELEKNLSFSPYRAKYKVAVIDQAERMNEEASNALLKTLEEPGKTTILILLTSDSGRLLETIRSRCQIFKFLPVTKEELRLRFKKEAADEKDLETIMELSGYKPGKIIDLIKNEDLKNELVGELEYLSGISKRSNSERMEKAEAMSDYDEEKIVGLLDLWIFGFRKELVSGYSMEKERKRSDIAEWARKIHLIKKTKEDILTKNINLKLALENLILGI
ncbi:MAG: DNA polymerase III subunit delta' [Candidatus Paceibacterota bacterium]|jgi:DNA polymerase-3 subunit delta'